MTALLDGAWARARRRVRGEARYWALWALVRAGGRLPVWATYSLGAAGAMLAWCASRDVRAHTRDHARHVLGPAAPARRVDAVARASARAAAYYYADFARLPRVSPETVFDHFDELTGIEHLFEALDAGRGLILVGAHLGGPELLAQAAEPFGLCLAIVTEPLSPPRVDRFVAQVRGVHGVRYLSATPFGLRASLSHLRQGGTLGLLIDRDVLRTAPPFPFFGERAPMPDGAVQLARRTGVPIIAAWVPRTGLGRYALHLERVELPEATGDRDADVESGMRVLVGALERAVRRWPGQWFAIAPVWRARD